MQEQRQHEGKLVQTYWCKQCRTAYQREWIKSGRATTTLCPSCHSKVVVADLEGNRQKVVNLLQEVGLHRAEAKCLGQLMYGNEVTSRQIEHDTYLRQSEVSVTMTRFKSRGWIRERNDNCTSGKGRPTKYYTLNVPIESIIVMIETDFNEKVKTKSEMFKMLKTLID